jgi:hypothetical protein
MERSHKFNRYSPGSYDNHLTLKPPLLLWIAVVYLSRAITLPVLVKLSALGGGSADTTEFMRGLFSASTLLPSGVAAIVLYPLLRRSPSASERARWIWARGRLLLGTAAVLDFVLSLTGGLAWHGELANPSPATLLTEAFDLYFLAYILASRRVRDTFADFPAPLEVTSK